VTMPTLDTQAIYDLTHRQMAFTDAAQNMMTYLWQEWGGYVGQLSWVTKGQLKQLAQKAALARDSITLDICCGTGGIARHLAQTTGCTMTGVDYSVTAIEIARSASSGHGEAVQFDMGDVRKLPYPDAHFDAAVSVDSLAIVPELPRVLAECARVLKPGGRIAFLDEILGGPPTRDLDILQAMGTYGRIYPQTESSYRRLLTHVGFVDIEISDSTDMFVAINHRWAESYRRYEPEVRKALGDKWFNEGLAFFMALESEGAAGRLRQILVSATLRPDSPRAQESRSG